MCNFENEMAVAKDSSVGLSFVRLDSAATTMYSSESAMAALPHEAATKQIAVS